MFNTLDPSNEGRKRSSAAFVCGLIAETLLIVMVSVLCLLFPQELPQTNTHYSLTWLQALTPPKQPVLKPPPEVARLVVPKLKPPVSAELPLPELVAPTIRPKAPPAQAHALEAPLPAAPIAQPSPPAKEQLVVRAGLFGGGAEPVTTKRPAQEVQTGGFGSQQGLPGRAQGDNPGNVPKVGSFGLPEGPGVGNGTGGAHGIQGVVASAGFGSGVAGTGNGRKGDGSGVAVGGFGKTNEVAQSPAANPSVATGGFEKAAPAAPSPVELPHAPPPTAFQPVEIFSKPTPAYTEEARRLRIQGEVALSVVFEATGAIRVIGVVKSLGHGLDQEAEQVATRIRFKPALRDGKPADFPATLRIEFRLADQSS